MSFLANTFHRLWNFFLEKPSSPGLQIGFQVKDGQISKKFINIATAERSRHIVILGKTGSGKSKLLQHFMSQDIASGRGLICIDLHGDLIPFVLSRIAAEERRRNQDLSKRLLLIDPSHPSFSVGLNLLDCKGMQTPAVQISEMVNLLKSRWSLDHFGARTEELLRNTLWVLTENGLTLLEVSPLLTNSSYRIALLRNVRNPEVKMFFEERYNRASDSMQTVMREAVLNKITAFTVDSAIRHIVGQKDSAVSLVDAIDHKFWVLLNLRKGNLGENALTFAGLFLAKVKNALFARKRRDIFTIYADELPNLVASGDSFEILLSEARKFGVSVVSANQFLNQFTPQVKSALLSVGQHLCFQLSSEDANVFSRAFGGGEWLSRRLRELEGRHVIAKRGEQLEEISIPDVKRAFIDSSNLVRRSNLRFAKERSQIEDEINARHFPQKSRSALEGWE